MSEMDDVDQECEDMVFGTSSEEEYNPFAEEKKPPKKRKYHKSQRQQKLDAETSVSFWKAILESVVGRREIWNILLKTGAFEDKFSCGPNGFPHESATWFYAGQKSYGLKFYAEMMAISPKSIVLMHEENDSRVMK